MAPKLNTTLECLSRVSDLHSPLKLNRERRNSSIYTDYAWFYSKDRRDNLAGIVAIGQSSLSLSTTAASSTCASSRPEFQVKIKNQLNARICMISVFSLLSRLAQPLPTPN